MVNSVGFGRILVGFCLIWSDLVGLGGVLIFGKFGRICSDLVGFQFACNLSEKQHLLGLTSSPYETSTVSPLSVIIIYGSESHRLY